jgi:hypothetical protein
LWNRREAIAFYGRIWPLRKLKGEKKRVLREQNLRVEHGG